MSAGLAFGEASSHGVLLDHLARALEAELVRQQPGAEPPSGQPFFWRRSFSRWRLRPSRTTSVGVSANVKPR